MRFLKYLRYLDLLATLLGFIEAAERELKGVRGPERLKVVAAKFAQLVTSFESSGLIKAKLATALRDGSEALISVIVQFMNAAEGGVIVAAEPIINPWADAPPTE